MKTFNRGVVKTLILLLTLTLINCQQPDDSQQNPNLQQENNQDVTVTSRIVSGADIPDIIAFVKSKSSPTLTFKFNETNYAAAPGGGGGGEPINHEGNLTITQAITDEIVTITQYSKTNYAFSMPSVDPDYSLNLIVVEHTDGDYMYFVKYVPNTGSNWDGNSIDTFEGVRYIYSDAGVYKTKSFHSNGTTGVYPCDCPDDDNDNGDGGGGQTCVDVQWVRCNWQGVLHRSESLCTCVDWGECNGFVPVMIEECTDNNNSRIQGSSVNHTSDICYCWDGFDDGDNTGGGSGSGGSGGNPVNSCPGVEPCTGIDESLDVNCECQLPSSNPNSPINVEAAQAARSNIKGCIGMAQESFWNDDDNWAETQAISDFIDANPDCSSANQNFIEDAIVAWEEDGEVDFVNGIIYDSSIVDTCVEDIIKDFILEDFGDDFLDNSLINKTFDALTGSGSGVNITYKAANLPGNGHTSQPVLNASTGEYDITVTIDTDLMANGTKLAIAKTMLHESIHAYLEYMRKKHPLEFGSPSGDFSALIAGWMAYSDLGYAHHVYMAELVGQMGEQLSNYAINYMGYPSNPAVYSPETVQEYYEAVAWSGIAFVADPSNPGSIIVNPLFGTLFPNIADQNHIIDIFTAENTQTPSNGVLPMLINNCN